MECSESGKEKAAQNSGGGRVGREPVCAGIMDAASLSLILFQHVSQLALVTHISNVILDLWVFH